MQMRHDCTDMPTNHMISESCITIKSTETESGGVYQNNIGSVTSIKLPF